MREIDVKKIRETVTELCLKANFELRKDILKALKSALSKETTARAKNILKAVLENARLAKKKPGRLSAHLPGILLLPLPLTRPVPG